MLIRVLTLCLSVLMIVLFYMLSHHHLPDGLSNLVQISDIKIGELFNPAVDLFVSLLYDSYVNKSCAFKAGSGIMSE